VDDGKAALLRIGAVSAAWVVGSAVWGDDGFESVYHVAGVSAVVAGSASA
jgi:hypothetical protein